MADQSRFRVTYYQDDNYEVWEYIGLGHRESKFQGSLSDCEAYIRLRLNPDVDFEG